MSFTPPGFEHGLNNDTSVEEAVQPVTSLLCQWNAPRKHKESNMQISNTKFEKHVYGRKRKHAVKPLADFDPRPEELRGNSKEQLMAYLDKVQGQGIGVSLLFDEHIRYWSVAEENTAQGSLAPKLPTKTELQERVAAFKTSLIMPQHKLREIEQSTRDQSESPLWYSVRRYRITASYFGSIFHRKPTTPPEALVLQIIQGKQFTSPATEWGRQKEALALKMYVQFQIENSHAGLYCCRSGLVISEMYPHLGASPDAVVHDPSTEVQFGVAEVKCPYSVRSVTPQEAAKSSTFFCFLDEGKLKLKRTHNYFCQVQGQMALTEREWCDFIVYTEKGISVERIKFDADFWSNDLLPKLNSFFDNCLAPEIVSPMHVLGLPVRNLDTMFD